MRKVVALLLLLSGCAGGTLQGTPQDYYENDRFQWTNYNDGVHILAAHSISLASSQFIYTKLHTTKLEAMLSGILIAGAIGTAKEVFHDAYAMKKDIKTWWGGALLGGATFTIINF